MSTAARDAIGMKGRGNAGRASAPVVSGDREPLETQRVGKIDEVLADGRLFGHARCGGVAKSRRAVSAEVRHQHAMAGGGERRGHSVPRPHVVRKPVQQDDRETGGAAAFLEPDVEHRRLNRTFHGSCRRADRGRRRRPFPTT